MATKKPARKASENAATKKKAATKKAAKKAVTKKSVTKKAVTKKAVTKKAAPKKAAAKKATKQTVTKKAVTKEVGKKKAAPKTVAKAASTPAPVATKKKTTRKKAAATPGQAGAVAKAKASAPKVDPAAMLGLVEEHNPNLDIPVKIGKRDLRVIEEGLRRIRNELTSDLDALTEQNLSNSGRDQSGDLSGYGFHMADVATDNWAREMALNIATGENSRLRFVEEALDRLNRDSYGRCDECGIPINVERLKVLPYAPRCIDCAETLERG